MNHFVVNGIEKSVPLQGNESFRGLIDYVRKTLAGEDSLVSSIRVNGVEINETEEQALAAVPLEELESVEIIFAHPREVAEETLNIMMPYCERLAEMSARAGTELEAGRSLKDFTKLVDGIQILIDSVATVRVTLRAPDVTAVNILEADLLSILKDLVESQDVAYRVALLREHLPKNLLDWKGEGLPALLRSRDS